MKSNRIVTHLEEMKKAIKAGDKNLYLLLLDTLVVKTNSHQQLIDLGDFAVKINNNNGLSINIINKGKYVKYIPNHDYITSEGIKEKFLEFQSVIDNEFYDQTDLLFRDMEVLKDDMDENIEQDE